MDGDFPQMTWGGFKNINFRTPLYSYWSDSLGWGSEIYILFYFFNLPRINHIYLKHNLNQFWLSVKPPPQTRCRLFPSPVSFQSSFPVYPLRSPGSPNPRGPVRDLYFKKFSEWLSSSARFGNHCIKTWLHLLTSGHSWLPSSLSREECPQFLYWYLEETMRVKQLQDCASACMVFYFLFSQCFYYIPNSDIHFFSSVKFKGRGGCPQPTSFLTLCCWERSIWHWCNPAGPPGCISSPLITQSSIRGSKSPRFRTKTWSIPSLTHDETFNKALLPSPSAQRGAWTISGFPKDISWATGQSRC